MHNLAHDQTSRPDDREMTIGAVSEVTGIPAPTIRSWERRHLLPLGRRTASGSRRYSRADAQALTRLRDEIAAGRSVAEAAALIRHALDFPPARVVDLLVAAADHLDSSRIHRELEQSRQAHGLVVTLDEVLLPALRDIGCRWEDGRSDVAHEHLLTGAVLRWLAVVEQQAPPATRPGPVVLACGPDDEHALGLQAFSVLLAHRGFDSRFLGAKTPIESLALAAQSCAAQAVVLVSQQDRCRPAALSALHHVSAQSWRLYYAGGAFTDPRWRSDTPGVYLGESFAAAAQQIADEAAPIGSTSRSEPDAHPR